MGQILSLLVLVLAYLATWRFVAFARARYSRRRRMAELGCEDPAHYPHSDFIFGLDLFFEDVNNLKNHSFLGNVKQRFDKYGQTFQAISMGKVAIHTNDPLNFKAVHSLNFQDYGLQAIRLASTEPFLGKGIFNMDGSVWEHARAKVRPTFTRSNIANLSAFEGHFQKFLKLVRKDGRQVDLMPLLYRLFLDTTTEFLFGEPLNTLSPNTPFPSTQFLDAFHYAQSAIGTRIRLGWFRFLYRDRRERYAIKVSHAFADRFVAEELQSRQIARGAQVASTEVESGASQRYILLHELAEETEDPVELRSHLLHVFLAGHDAIAITIGNALFHLSRQPDIWQKLKQVVKNLGDSELTFEVLKDMRYVQYILRETLRLHPIAPADTRVALRDTVFPTGGGPSGTSPILVSAGQVIISSSHALHRRQDIWGLDAEDFVPERWEKCRLGFHYHPFGAGPRMCPGQNLSLTLAAYVLVRMSQEFSVCECRDDVWEYVEDFKITASSFNGFKVGLVAA